MFDSKENLKCANCGAQMEKILIDDGGFYLDVCSKSCGAIFFDNQELKKIINKKFDISKVLELTKNKDSSKIDSSKTRICPSCGSKMVKNKSSFLYNAPQIDECYCCGGIFLDPSELELILKENNSKELSKANFDKYLSEKIKRMI